MSPYEIREMTRHEVDIAIDWAAKEGWNPGLYDADCFYKMDRHGFFTGLLNGEVIATISAVKYGDTYGFMGFYMVKPEFRSKGYGMKLFQHAWKYLGEANKAGDGVLENLKLYKRVGLNLDHLNARYQGFGSGTRKLVSGMTELSKVSFDVLLKYDTEVFGFNRENFLRCWIKQPESYGYAVTTGKNLMGYGVLRKCRSGYKIGPLFADSPQVAQDIFGSLLSQIGKDDEVYFDIPEVNKGAREIAKSHRMKKVFATGRIYTEGRPKSMNLEKWYGVTTFELG